MQPNDIISISGWIVAALLGIPAAVYYGRRVLKDRASEKVKNTQQVHEMAKLLVAAQVAAEKYEGHEFTGYSVAWFDSKSWLKKGIRDELLRLQGLAKEFEFWLNLAKDLVSATIFKAAYYNGTFSEFSQKMDQTGRGYFHDLLWRHLWIHVLNGKSIAIPWLRDNCPDFYSQMMSVGSERDMEHVLEPIQGVAQNQCLQIMREKQQEFLKTARQTITRLGRLAGEK